MNSDPKVWAFWVAVASLLWNLCNTLYTRSVDSGNRQRSVRLEEFRSSVRQPIDTLLSETQDLEIKAENHAQTQVYTESDKTDLISLNKEITALGRKLVKRLDDADRSQFSDGANWADRYFAKEDAILDAMNTATASDTSPENRRIALIMVSKHLTALRRNIREALEDQVSELAK